MPKSPKQINKEFVAAMEDKDDIFEYEMLYPLTRLTVALSSPGVFAADEEETGEQKREESCPKEKKS